MVKPCYRLVFRAIDRDANSSFARPSFRCQLPSNLFRDGTNKKIKVYLEYAGIHIKKVDPHGSVIVKLRDFAVNGSQTNGAGVFENISTLGIAGNAYEHGSDIHVETANKQDIAYLVYNAFQFNQGRIDFILQQIDGTDIEAPTGDENYVIMLAIKEMEDDEY